MAKILDIQQTVTQNGVVELPILQQVTPKKTKQVARAIINVQVPPTKEVTVKVVEKLVEVIKEVPPTEELCRQLYPCPATQVIERVQILPFPQALQTPYVDIGFGTMIEKLSNLGLSCPNPLYSHSMLRAVSYLDYSAFYNRYLWGIVTGGLGSAWVCYDEALWVLAMSRKWFPLIAMASCTGNVNYVTTPHAWNFFFDKIGDVWFIDSTWERIRNFSRDGVDYGVSISTIIM